MAQFEITPSVPGTEPKPARRARLPLRDVAIEREFEPEEGRMVKALGVVLRPEPPAAEVPDQQAA